MKMYETKIAIITFILATSIMLSRGQQQQSQNRRQLLQQQLQEKLQQRQQQQLERQLAQLEKQTEELPTISNNISSVSQNKTENLIVSNQSVFLDNVFNIPIQALQAVNQLVRHISQNLQAITARMSPTTVRPVTENEFDEIDF